MSLNQSIIIGNSTIHMYGDAEDPLFDCQQVLIQLLGYKKSGENRFYKDNKYNEKYIREADCLHRESKQFDKQKKYFTEIGLYRCLFTSQKPIAIEFQEQVALLLKDLRLGNLKLQVQKECESTRLLAESKTSIMSYVTKLSEIEQQMVDLRQQLQNTQKRLANAQEDVYIYEIEIDGKKYRGSAIDVLRRIKQHMNKSSNRQIRRSQSQGCPIKVNLLHKQTVSNRHERNYIESTYIQQIPNNIRLNDVIPRVRDMSLVSEECKEILRDAIQNPQYTEIIQNNKSSEANEQQRSRSRSRVLQQSNIQQNVAQPIAQQIRTNRHRQQHIIQPDIDLTVILEERGRYIEYSSIVIQDHIDYINDDDIDVEFKDKIQKIRSFAQQKGFTPRDSNNADEVEHALGRFLVKIRNVYRTKQTAHYDLSEQRYAYIKQIIPDLLQDDNQPFYNRVMQLKQFIQVNKRMPKQRAQNELESQLYDWLAHRRTDVKQEKLNQSCIDFFNEQLPDLKLVVPNILDRFKVKLNELLNFIQEHKRYPTQKENKLLQSFVRDLQTAETPNTKSRIKLTPEMKHLVNSTIVDFPW